ncbi:TetR/AcrR family transcriptional regulator [Virgibacillus ihumii]|uniref:TetR/AcrR family transcriptional regulator n=1 Tax=Virgibacillus ihumii TaxID=2686091 RepID=UPI00157DAED3|nr:TetR/AcrR family transcriptional regulator [Virgibacillus ihumii]
MNEKKKKIIETSFELFARKGFYATSIQEIADKSNLSKGAFYLHFQSKDELLLELFKYYYDLIQENVQNAVDEKRSAKENFVKQVEVQFREILRHKSFIITQLKEQAITLNQELFEFVRLMEYETHNWYKQTLISIYGERIKPYVADLVNIIEGIKNRYFQVLIRSDMEVDIDELASFIVEQFDTIAANLLSNNTPPILTEEKLQPIFSDIKLPEKMIKKEVINTLLEMQKLLNDLKLDDKEINELQGVIDFMISEMKKPDTKEFVIQGLLANFKGIEEFDHYRQLISEKLQVRLL